MRRGSALGVRARMLLAVVAVALLFGGCYSKKNYSGASRPKSEVATILYENAGSLQPVTINGARPKSSEYSYFRPKFFAMEVLPGRVEVTVCLGRYLISKANQRLVFEAAAGREYMLDFWIDDARKTWSAYVKEKGSDKEIARGVPFDPNDVNKPR